MNDARTTTAMAATLAGLYGTHLDDRDWIADAKNVIDTMRPIMAADTLWGIAYAATTELPDEQTFAYWLIRHAQNAQCRRYEMEETVTDMSTFHIWDGALHHCPDPDDPMGHVVQFVDASDSLFHLVKLATRHECEKQEETQR